MESTCSACVKPLHNPHARWLPFCTYRDSTQSEARQVFHASATATSCRRNLNPAVSPPTHLFSKRASLISSRPCWSNRTGSQRKTTTITQLTSYCNTSPMVASESSTCTSSNKRRASTRRLIWQIRRPIHRRWSTAREFLNKHKSRSSLATSRTSRRGTFWSFLSDVLWPRLPRPDLETAQARRVLPTLVNCLPARQQL